MHEQMPSSAAEHQPSSETIDHNLELMNGEMLRVLATESVGGNARGATIDGKPYPCVGANGFATPEGKILVFGNIQDVDAQTRRSAIPFAFRIAFDWRKGGPFRIIDTIPSHGKVSFTPEGVQALEHAAAKWNAERQEK